MLSAMSEQHALTAVEPTVVQKPIYQPGSLVLRRRQAEQLAADHVMSSVFLLIRAINGEEPGFEYDQPEPRLRVLAGKMRMQAAIELANRGIGKPTTKIEKNVQSVTIDANKMAEVMKGMSDDQLDALQAALRQLKGGGPAETGQPVSEKDDSIEVTATAVDEENW